MGMLVGIAGITGRYGHLLANEILEVSDASIRGFCRNPAKINQSLLSSSRFEIAEGGAFDRDAVVKFVKSCDAVVCCYLGDDNLMTEGQKLLIDACEENRVPRYVASDWSLDYTKLELGQLFVKDPMKHVKAYLETKSFVKGVHVLNGVFLETLFSPYFGIYDQGTHTFSHWGNPGVPFEGTTYKNSTQYTARVVLNKDAIGIQRFVGDRKSMSEIAESYEKVYGIKAKVVVKGSAKELYDHMWQVRNQNDGQVFKYLAMFYQYYMINEQTYVGPDHDNMKYPDVTPITYEDFMRSTPLEQLTSAYQNLADAKS